MAGLPLQTIRRYCDLYPKPRDTTFQYGTAGFRTSGSILESTLFRIGIFAGLRSKRLESKTIGIMITASHNPESDNGVKVVDPRGEMLEASWEVHATNLANATTTDAFIKALETFVGSFRIDLARPANVMYARDTRPSGPSLVAALEDGLKAIGALGRDEGVKTTPLLHYLVRCVNTKGTKEEYGEPTEEGYMIKLSTAFKKLMHGKSPVSPLVVDCANGVGFHALAKLIPYISDNLQLIPVNFAPETPGSLNYNCGADFVKTQQRLPPSLHPHLKANQRACSFDGDADRIIYYYLDERGQFRLLDGDKIAALVAGFIVELVKGAGLEGKMDVGIVQTAYANGASTKYLSERLPVKCVSTGVKHLHHAAEHFAIGVYFEANGHGTVLFQPLAVDLLLKHEPVTPAQSTCLKHLVTLTELINQAVGDALSDMLLVEAVLAHKAYNAFEWDSIYTDLPNRLIKVQVKDRSIFKTEDAERRLVAPPGLQNRIDELVRKYEGARSFVRPSGTEDVVRVYAEAARKPEVDELVYKVGSMVYDEGGSDSPTRPQ